MSLFFLNSDNIVEFNFTIDKSDVVDKKILSDLQVIKKLLLNNLNNVHSLILVGGFGRGEGSVLMNSGKPEPINDYDIVLVSENKPVPLSRLKELSEKITKKIEIRLVDLILIEKSQMPELPYTMFNYDMKYGGYIFWGEKNILREVPDYDPKKMPLVEGKILLFNRMICLLESYSDEFSKRHPDENERFFLINQSSKVILACCDSLLILKGLYHHSYVERCKRFSEEYSGRVKCVNLVSMATDFKLKPTRNNDINAVEFWFDAREIFTNVLLEFMECFYSRRFENIKVFCDFYNKMNMSFFKRVLSFFKPFKGGDLKRNIELFELYLLGAINPSSYIDEYMGFCRRTFKGLHGNKYTGNPVWEEMRKECVSMWFKCLH